MRQGDLAGSFRLFRFAGIQVYIHWSWFLMAAVLVQFRAGRLGQSGYEALVDILAVFGIVLLHEFGHALACRSVGGRANTIVLWPLGGVAFVQPPPRPGAMLWSLAAGPLVNVVLVPVTLAFALLLRVPPEAFYSEQVLMQLPRLHQFAVTIAFTNFALLVFNMLPVYPLDGGQILQSLLWFVVGRSKSLLIASGIGLVLSIGGLLLALSVGELWLMMMAAFLAWQAYNGMRTARVLMQIESSQRNNPWQTATYAWPASPDDERDGR